MYYETPLVKTFYFITDYYTEILTGIVLVGIIIIISIFFIKMSIKCKRAGLKIGCASQAHGIILGRFPWMFLYSPEEKESHIACFGSSGSGKTTTVNIPSLRSLTSRFFAIDISGDISQNVQTDNQIIFEPLNQNSIAYNAFHRIDHMSHPNLQDEALINMTFAILPDIATQDNSKWFDDGDRDILKAGFIGFYHIGMDFLDICIKIVTHDYVTLFEEIDKLGNSEASKYITQFSGANEKSISGCLQSAQKALQIFTSPRLKHVLHRPTGNEFVYHAESVEIYNIFFKIPDNLKEQYSGLVSLVVNQMLEYLSDRPNSRTDKILISIDEFASFKGFDITEPLQKLRKRNVRIMILLQSLAQLDRNYGYNARREMIDNFDINVLCKVSEVESQKYFSDKVGTTWTTRKTKNSNGEISTTDIEVPIYNPTDFGRLSKKLIVLANGEHFKVRKAFFFKKIFR